MKLNEVKNLKEEIHKKQLKEMFPTATDAQIDYALNEAPNFGGAVKTLGNLTKQAGKAAVATGKKAVKTAAPIVKKGAQAAVAGGKAAAKKTGQVAKQVATKTGQVAKQVGKDVGKGYKNVKKVAGQTLDVAGKALDAAGKEIDSGEPAVDGKKTTMAVRRLQNVTGGNQAAITSQALQKAAAGEVLKPNERQAMAPLAKAINNALQKGSNVQRIISLLKA
jgi:hypothetical protein